jgi:ABC-type transport system, involved in lipoprotein release, permease component
MEILTILKANIRHKKGSFLSIVLLMAMISMALVSIISVTNNIYDGIIDAHERMQTGNIICMIDKNKLTEELLSDVERHALVDRVETVETIAASALTYRGNEYGNDIFLREDCEGYRLFNQKGTGFQKEIPTLRQGEIYISQGIKTTLSCGEGDAVTITVASGSYDFTIAGIIEDPELGAQTIGWKNIFLSWKDYEKLYSEVDKLAKPEENYATIVTQLSIDRVDGSSMTDARFARQVNLDTKIIDMGIGSLIKDLMVNYTYLFPKIICMILMVFLILLFVAVVVVMCHSLSAGIEMEYTTFGVMKAQGFVKRKIRIILAAQYLMAEIGGMLLGAAAAVPLCRGLGNIFQPITGIVPRRSVSLGECTLILCAVLGISVLCILLITRKISKIMPVRAIAGGKNEIYFDGRCHVAIRKKLFSVTLAFRQFTSNMKQYLGVGAIVAMLVYFMAAMMVLVNVITATSAWEAMGIDYSDLDISFEKGVTKQELGKVEESLGKICKYQISYQSCGNSYLSVDGEQMMACIYSDGEFIKAVSEGRNIRYDNEIVMTEIAADNLGLNIGDKVSVGYRDKKAEYIICGLNQHMNDAGVNFSMTMGGAVRIFDEAKLHYAGYILEDKSLGEKAAARLSEQYGELLTVEYDDAPMDETYQLAINAMTLVVYIFSVIFSMIVVHMVCSKAFIRERRDIGIYKALGFTAGRLRLQFAVRFSMVAAFGAVAGCGLAALFAEGMLSAILRQIGISNFQMTFRFSTFAVPILLICACFFLFSYTASRKVKRVEVRELVQE